MDKNSKQEKYLNVTDLSSYLYCPRRFYLEKIKGIKSPPTRQMIEGKIRHRISEDFSNKEKEIVENLNEQIGETNLILGYKGLLNHLIKNNFEKYEEMISKFKISAHELQVKILESLNNDIKIRAEAVQKTMQKGFLGKELWNNLKPKYISEMPLISERLELKGRADRVLISQEAIIPFELKTREAEKIWPSDEIQLTAYSMLLEEKYSQPVPLAILEAGNKRHEIIITSEMKQKVLELIKEIKDIFINPNKKFPSNFSKCQKCSYTEECDEL